MIQMIKNPCYELFLDMVASCNEEIALCAPFVKTEVINKILFAKKQDIKLSLVTNSNLAAFAAKGSDLEAIKQVLHDGHNVYNYQNLHAKVYIFDKTKAIISSANLTYGGLINNYEYGVLIQDDETAISRIMQDYQLMLKHESCGVFNEAKISYIEKTVANLPQKIQLIIDCEGDMVLTNNNLPVIEKELNGWQRTVFEMIVSLNGNEFSNQQLLNFIPYLKEKYPNSKTPDRTLSRVLQELRDMGLIKFTKRGYYKKLWIEK